MANELTFYLNNSLDEYIQIAGGAELYGEAGVGHYDVPDGEVRGAIRFPNVNISKASVPKAVLYFRMDNVYGSNIKATIRGIAHDNCPQFTSNPFGLSYTSSNTSVIWGSPGANSWADIDVTSQFNEVINRSGWQSGNAVGFFLRDNGTTGKNYADDVVANGEDSFLILTPTQPNFKPTPVTVTAPTFPDVATCAGIKIAYPGQNVFEATDEELFFTTRKRVHKVIAEGSVDASAGVEYQIAHGQDHIPFAMVFVKSPTGNGCYKLPRYFAPGVQSDPYTDSLNGTLLIDSTYLRISVTQNAAVYYYIFLDDLV